MEGKLLKDYFAPQYDEKNKAANVSLEEIPQAFLHPDLWGDKATTEKIFQAMKDAFPEVLELRC